MEHYVLNLLLLMILNNLVSMLIEYFYNLLNRKSKIIKYIWYLSAFISLYIGYLMLKLLYIWFLEDIQKYI